MQNQDKANKSLNNVLASVAEAQAGSDNTKVITPLRLRDGFPNAITANKASAAEAIAGTDDTKIMTPLKLRNGLNAGGSAPVYACRAWVNFNGTTNTGGYCTIQGSGNVSSVADNGVGVYTVNFTSSISDSNYSVSACARLSEDGTDNAATPISYGISRASGGMSSSSLKIVFARADVGTFTDCSNCCVNIHR